MSDGHRPYLAAMDTVFGDDADYAMLVKLYGADPAGEKRYSAAKCIGARKHPVSGSQTRSTSARHMRSGRTSRCICAASSA